MSDDRGERAEWLAPVIPISGGFEGAQASDDPVRDAVSDTSGDAGEAEAAERLLLRRLRTRSLSVSEATGLLRDVDAATRSSIIDRFVDLGYLDDAALAEQLVRAGSERKGQGRRALASSLAARGLRADAVDAALASLPDDDAERALDFARSKTRRAPSGDREGDLRRLVGQLSRRGYPSSVALSAARTALDEQGRGDHPG